MDGELLQPVVEFLGTCAPFDQVETQGRAVIARTIEVEYRCRGTEIQGQEASTLRVYVVRSGAVNELNAAGQLVARHSEGECINGDEVWGSLRSTSTLVCHEDCLLYSIEAEKFRSLCKEFSALAQGFSPQLRDRLRSAKEGMGASEDAFSASGAQVSSLLTRSLVSVDALTRIVDAAKLMTEQRVSCVLVTGANQLGIVTDRDFRRRVVATGKSLQDPIASIMSCPVHTIDSDTPVFEAFFEMMVSAVHHLAVVENGLPVGILTTTDLVRRETENPVYIVNDLNRQDSRAGLASVINERRDRVLERLVAAGARPLDVHRVLTLIGDAVTRRLIHFAESEWSQKQAGPMPPYCWLALGSQARHEMTLGSDQDNAMIIGAGVDADHPALRWLSESVCEGLELCGYPKCPGDIMASVQRWRQPEAIWQGYFERWIHQPAAKATIEASIFFDMRSVAGDASLMLPLVKTVSAKAKQQSIFLAHLAHEATLRRPPLGIFRQFVLEKGGEHANTLDLKHRGLAPVVELARFFALEAGAPRSVDTLARLEAASKGDGLSAESASELKAAFEWIAWLRLQHQARCLSEGRAPDSFVSPDELSAAERRHLQDAFRAIKSIQDSVHSSRQLGVFG